MERFVERAWLAVVLLAACDRSKPDGVLELSRSRDGLESCAAITASTTPMSRTDGVRSIVVPDMEPVCEARLEAVIQLMAPAGAFDLLPGKSVSRRSDGVYVSNVFGENALAIWDSTGRFMRVVGRSGAGPGEFASGIQPVFGPGDSLHAMDNSRHLSVFDDELRYVRRSLQLNAHRPAGSWFLTVDGRRFVSPPPPGVRSHHVAELHSDGTVRSLLVPADAATTGPDIEAAERTIAHGGGDTFWIGPTQVPEQKYEMEEWSLDGRLLRRMRRDAAWFIPYKLSEDSEKSSPPSTYFAMLQVDGSGFVHTAVSSREGTNRKAPSARTSRTERKAGISVRWEILDPNSGALIASTRFSDVDSVPMPFVPHTSTAPILVDSGAESFLTVIARWILSAPSQTSR